MRESPDVRSVVTLEKLIRILNSLHDECISRELRSWPAFFIIWTCANVGAELIWRFVLCRFGISCAVCLEELTEPSVLPCQHVTCLTCLQRYLNPHRRSCPTCRMELPLSFEPTVSLTIKWVKKKWNTSFYRTFLMGDGDIIRCEVHYVDGSSLQAELFSRFPSVKTVSFLPPLSSFLP